MFNDLLNLIFNNGCYACNAALTQAERMVCLNCLGQMEETHFDKKPKDNELYYRFAGKVPLEGATSLFYFDKKGKIQKLLHQLKYKDQPEMGTFLGEYWGAELKNSAFLDKVDSIIPVPLHARKEIQRGYNQSTTIAEGLQKETNIPFLTDILAREKKTETQALMARIERWRNVADAFVVKKTPPKHILLIDDVITTGSTVEACIKALFAHPEPPLTVKVASLAIPRGR
jgi:competence protein ComFC